MKGKVGQNNLDTFYNNSPEYELINGAYQKTLESIISKANMYIEIYVNLDGLSLEEFSEFYGYEMTGESRIDGIFRNYSLLFSAMNKKIIRDHCL
jgi:hypothetical protein